MKFCLCLYLFFLCSCDTRKDFRKSFVERKYDSSVILRLKIYDSLRNYIIKNIDSLKPLHNYYSAYYYDFDKKLFWNPTDTIQFPKTLSSSIKEFFLTLGKGKILGFGISEDTTIDIMIRVTHLPEYFLDVRERLKWMKNISKHQDIRFPIKDTSLGNNWYYIIWFDKRSHMIFD
jgi:hypothetical protein